MDAKDPLPAPPSARGGPVPCPRCEEPLTPGSSSCRSCSLPLTGPVAAQLWSVDQQLTALAERRRALLEDLGRQSQGAGRRTGSPFAVPSPPASPVVAPVVAPAAPVVAPAGVAASAPVPAGTAEGVEPARAHGGAQQLLLATGVVLLVAASVGFSVWSGLGATGLSAGLLVVCLAAGAGSAATARRALVASAEALAILAVVVADVGAGAARALDLFGLGALRWGVYWAGSLLVIIGACVAADRLLTAGAPSASARRPRAYAWAAVLASVLVPSSLTAALRGGALTWAALALALACGAVLLAPLAERRARGLLPTVLGIGAVHLVGGGATALGMALARVGVRTSGEAAAELAALTLVAVLLAPRLAADRPRTAFVVRVTAWAAGAGTLVALATTSAALGMPLVAAALCVGVLVVLTLRRGAPWAALVAAQATAAAALLLAPFVTDSPRTWVTPVAWALLAASCALTGRRRPTPVSAGARLTDAATASWTAASLAAALCAAALVPGPTDRPARLVLVLAVAGGCGALTWWWSRRAGLLETVGVAGWAVAGLVALLLSVDDGSPAREQVVLALAGAQALAYCSRHRRLAWCLPAAVLLTAAWWVHADAARWSTLEEWTLPPAALVLAIGAAAWHRIPAAPSWVTLGPGLVIGLLPSALACLDSDSLTGVPTPTDTLRAVCVVVVAVSACAVGVWRGWQAPLVLGAVAGILVAVAHLWFYASSAPVWVVLALAGVAVFALAIRVEQARRDAARAVTWLRALH